MRSAFEQLSRNFPHNAIGIESEYIFTGFGGCRDNRITDRPINRRSACELV